jgi:asparagine synthase (glutamine-hydrolysing)
MCGIYGTTIPYDDFLVRQKLLRVNFRGPDYSAFERVGRVVLGHNRLSIIDLDSRSNQPLTYKHLKIVFNGEIYNYIKLKADLIRKGFVFQTNSDTEVICAAYLAYGNKCVNHFNGMFAFVIYDTKDETLFGARDRLGKKPFYYYLQEDGFEFASQPSQIKIGNHLQVNQQAIASYLNWNYVPDELCIYEGVKKLKAGHCFLYEIESATLKVERYWDVDFFWENKFKGDYNEAKEELNTILNDSVKIRLNADVPVGIFLSGGIDSSLVAGIAAGMGQHVRTFNISFNEKQFDESNYATTVANHFQTDHHTIECSYHSGIDLIDNYNYYFDEPFADPSAIPLMLMAKYTKPFVTVVLSGDGGDESFLGYTRYHQLNKVAALYNQPAVIRKSISWLLNLSPNYRHKLIAMGLRQRNITALYVKMASSMDKTWLANNSCADRKSNEFILNHKLKPLMEKISDYDIKTYLNDDINTKVDRATMAYALEARAPLMDYRVVEFANSLPTKFKLNKSLGGKSILKDILYQKIPAHMFDRPKAGFTVPIKNWFKAELKEYVLDNLNGDTLRDIPGIHIENTKKMIEAHMAGKVNYASQIWSLLILNQWLTANKRIHLVEA